MSYEPEVCIVSFWEKTDHTIMKFDSIFFPRNMFQNPVFGCSPYLLKGTFNTWVCIFQEICFKILSLAASYIFNPLRPRQNGLHFGDDIFKCIFSNENVWILIKISQNFVPMGSVNNIPTLVQIMAWNRPGDKPLSEPMMVYWRIYTLLSLNGLKGNIQHMVMYLFTSKILVSHTFT